MLREPLRIKLRRLQGKSEQWVIYKWAPADKERMKSGLRLIIVYFSSPLLCRAKGFAHGLVQDPRFVLCLCPIFSLSRKFEPSFLLKFVLDSVTAGALCRFPVGVDGLRQAVASFMGAGVRFSIAYSTLARTLPLPWWHGVEGSYCFQTHRLHIIRRQHLCCFAPVIESRLRMRGVRRICSCPTGVDHIITKAYYRGACSPLHVRFSHRIRYSLSAVCAWTVVVAMVVMAFWTFAVATCVIPVPGRRPPKLPVFTQPHEPHV